MLADAPSVCDCAVVTRESTVPLFLVDEALVVAKRVMGVVCVVSAIVFDDVHVGAISGVDIAARKSATVLGGTRHWRIQLLLKIGFRGTGQLNGLGLIAREIVDVHLFGQRKGSCLGRVYAWEGLEVTRAGIRSVLCP